jgi:hypothetical protein
MKNALQVAGYVAALICFLISLSYYYTDRPEKATYWLVLSVSFEVTART